MWKKENLKENSPPLGLVIYSRFQNSDPVTDFSLLYPSQSSYVQLFLKRTDKLFIFRKHSQKRIINYIVSHFLYNSLPVRTTVWKVGYIDSVLALF